MFNFSYDSENKTGYLSLLPGNKIVRTQEYRKNIMIDLDENDNVVGIEFLE